MKPSRLIAFLAWTGIAFCGPQIYLEHKIERESGKYTRVHFPPSIGKKVFCLPAGKYLVRAYAENPEGRVYSEPYGFIVGKDYGVEVRSVRK